MMRVEGLTVCVGYDDFLEQTLPWNRLLCDDYLVVTSYEDTATQNLCKHLSIECRPTDLFNKNGAQFAKGRAVDWGLGFLKKDGWVAHIDADTAIPPGSRNWLERAELDEDAIYGCDRFNIVGYDKWVAYRDSLHTQPQHRIGCLFIPPPFPLGARFGLPEHNGYLPIGYFQLWNAAKHPARRYPLNRTNCEHDDVLMALQWPRNKRALLEELFALHLESADTGYMGANWNGRRTPRFGPRPQQPCPPPQKPCSGGKP